MRLLLYSCALGVMIVAQVVAGAAETERIVQIQLAPDSSQLESFAAREIQRYLYVRTGELVAISPGLGSGDAIVVARRDRAVVDPLRAEFGGALDAMGDQDYLLTSRDREGARTVYVIGGGDIGALYGAYRFAELLGVRFYLHGDVIPDRRIPLALPQIHKTASPLFALRGIQPFHDFPEGPDWWETDNYRAIIGQLPKLRMNFIGLHTYPEKRPNAEPTVWIGHREDVAPDGNVTFGYPAIYYNTALPVNWGLQPMRTSEYACGAAALFTRDDYGSDVMNGLTPMPDSTEACAEVFNRAGAMLRDAFTLAHALGVKTCVGTETPLVIPQRVQERHSDVAELYEGMFTRIMRAYPADYYWLWTPETWTWEGTTPDEAQRTIDDILMARAALEKTRAPFKLATAGWVLGPQFDRALLDKVLPKDVALSCISRSVGHDPVEPAFAEIEGRNTWAIPWLEDDPAMTSPQLWVGRMRRDARDALEYGCTGLMGIHWRTRILAPNVAALSQAAWSQPPSSFAPPATGAVGGATVTYAGAEITGTDDDPLYRSVRYRMQSYAIVAPNGAYRVTLHFCEPHYDAVGKRVFGVRFQNTPVIEHLDVFSEAGKNAAIVRAFDDVRVDEGVLNIDFMAEIEFPCIAAIAVEGEGFSYKVNCGGDAYGEFVADPPAIDDFLPADDFYADWAFHEFGPEIGEDAARIFTAIDGKLPRPSDWIGGPGGYVPDARPWDAVAPEYAFVDELSALQTRVSSVGDRARFHYWLETLEFLRATGKMRCAWGAYDAAIALVEAETSPDAQRAKARDLALPLRKALIAATEDAYAHLLAAVQTTGEMGTVANLEQHTFPAMLDTPGKRLAQILGEPLPPDAVMPSTYDAPARIIVPAMQTSVSDGEDLNLRVIVLDSAPPNSATLYFRTLGAERYDTAPLPVLARNTLQCTIPNARVPADGLEYYIEINRADGDSVRWPATATALNQTVIRGPAATRSE